MEDRIALTPQFLLRRSMTAWRLPVSDLYAHFGPRAGAYFMFLDTYTRSLVVPSAFVASLWTLPIKPKPARAAARLFVAWWTFRLVRKLASRPAIPKAIFGHHQQIHQQSFSLQEEQQLQLSPDQSCQRAKHCTFYCGSRVRRALLKTIAVSLSASVTSAWILGVSALILASLNLQGYINSKSSRFAVPALQRMAAPGALFDCQHPVRSWFPVFFHSIVVRAVNYAYSSTARWLSSWDGSGTRGVIFKRLLFEALDAFMPIVWLGVIRGDSLALAQEVEGLYTFDQIRRMLFESVLPYIRVAILRVRRAREAAILPRPEETENLQEWDDFDDWLEMVLQIAYIAFLGADALFVFPVSLISNILEEKSDVFKLCCCHRRPPPEDMWHVARDVETWNRTMICIAYGSIFGNIVSAVRILCFNVEVAPFRSPLPWAPRPPEVHCAQPLLSDVGKVKETF